jgi:glutathione reductase (NADPH)
VVVDEFSRTNVEHIFAVGDVTDRMNLTPVAIREGQAFAMTEFLGQPTAFDHADVPTAVFVQPPVGTVGLAEADARRKFGAVDIYKVKFRPMRDMLTGDEERVLMKIVVRAEDDRVIGVHIVGPQAHEIIQAVAIAVKMGATKKDFDRTCALHPSIAEELVTIKEKWKPPELAAE